jgi:hypothetical protein
MLKSAYMQRIDLLEHTHVRIIHHLAMDSGLSSRMERALDEVLPSITAAATPQHYDATAAVDLSSAQNEVLRPELVEFFKSTVEDKVTGKVC